MTKKTKPKSGLLKYLDRIGVTPEEAVKMLEEEIQKPVPIWKKYLKAIIPPYEKR